MTRSDLAMGIIILAILVVIAVIAVRPGVMWLAIAVAMLQAFSIGREWRCRR